MERRRKQNDVKSAERNMFLEYMQWYRIMLKYRYRVRKRKQFKSLLRIYSQMYAKGTENNMREAFYCNMSIASASSLILCNDTRYSGSTAAD